MREKLRRVFPVISVMAILLSVCAIPASAADKVVLNYLDYSFGESEDYLGNKVISFQLPSKYCAVQQIDKHGDVFLDPGVFSGKLVGEGTEGYTMSIGAYWPSGYIDGVFLDAKNFPDDTEVLFDFDFEFDDYYYQTTVYIYFCCRVSYFDSSFHFIGYDSSDVRQFELVGNVLEWSNYTSLKLNIPKDAKYLGFYSTFNMVVGQSNDDEFVVNWSITLPYFEATIPSIHTGGASDVELGDGVLWLSNVVDSFLSFELMEGFSLNKVLYFVLVLGLLFWFIRVVS